MYLIHLIQPFNISMFLKFKYKFKKLLREEVFHSIRQIIKADFFALFNKFSVKTFT